jgi:hypothetical protein
MEAGLKSSAARDLGDIFNHGLWQRVMMAVQELDRGRPSGGGTLN